MRNLRYDIFKWLIRLAYSVRSSGQYSLITSVEEFDIVYGAPIHPDVTVTEFDVSTFDVKLRVPKPQTIVTEHDNSELYDFSAKLKVETENAYLVTYNGKDYWLPESLTQDNQDGTFTIPEWLAIEKGLV